MSTKTESYRNRDHPGTTAHFTLASRNGGEGRGEEFNGCRTQYSALQTGGMEPAARGSFAGCNPWPLVIIAYFIVFISCTVAGVVYLSRQKMDLVRGDYYDDEIRYQEQLDRMNRTRQLNAPMAIGYDSAHQAITISLPSTRVQSQVSGRIRLYRPSDESLDRDIQLAVGADGVQRVDAKNLRSGLWKVRVYWTVKGQDYFFGDTVVVRRAQS